MHQSYIHFAPTRYETQQQRTFNDMIAWLDPQV